MKRNISEKVNSVMKEEETAKTNKHVSKALKLISKRPGAIDSFMLYRNEILSKGPLSEKERFLIALAATVVLKSPDCIWAQTINAKNAGATEEEIIQTMLITGLVSGNSPLNTAYASLFDKIQL